ncbi:MAG: hypothetical protein MRZ63_02565 [Anaerostipes sp.]|nr:hypothetical protein [Anaerostipes sp.]MDD5968716.1 hypothetical protein [Anaerostipes sp.]
MEYRKTYQGFILWMIGFIIASIGAAFLPFKEDLLIRITLNICTIGAAILTYIIYKTEYIYWYNGTSYEEAKNAGSERRKQFAWRHLKRFGLFAIAFFLFSVFAQVCRLSFWIDFWILCLGILATAISTIRFQL